MKTLIISLVLLSGCSTVGGQVLKNCELAQLSQIEQSAAVCVTGALNNPADWRSAVLTCGGSLLPAQLNCIVAAIVAAAEGGGLKASPVVERGRIWLNEHNVRVRACH